MRYVALLLFLLTTPSWAAPKTKNNKKAIPAPIAALSPEAELQAYQEQMKGFQFLTVNFKQTTYKDLRKNTVKSHGKASFQRPNQFHWWTLEPVAIQEEWIFTGTELFNHKGKSVTRYPVTGPVGKEIGQVVDMVINFDQLMKKYTLQKLSKTEEGISVVLLPKIPSDIETATLQLHTKKLYISQVHLVFAGKNHSTFDFTDPDFQKKDPALFAAPKGMPIQDAL